MTDTLKTDAPGHGRAANPNDADTKRGGGLSFGADDDDADLTRGGRWIAKAAGGLAVFLGLFHYWTGYSGGFPFYRQRSFHLAVAMTVLLLGIMAAATGRRRYVDRIVALVCIGIVVGLMGYIYLNDDEIIRTFKTFDTPYLFWAGAVVLIGLELARRVVGAVLPGIVLLCAALILAGSYWSMPWSEYIVSITLTDMVNTLGFKNYGMMGSITGVSAGIVGSFLVFGGLLSVSGGAQSFLNLARFLVGRYRGGPGKVSIITSSFFGTVSGSAVANVVVDGVFNIPLMKRSGFRPSFAAAVEATTSSGGQLVPPVMGASAFIMAELLGISYSDVILAALVPIFLFYVGLFIAIHIEAVKQGLPGIPRDQIPKARSLINVEFIGSFILPIGMMLVTLYVWGRSLLFASFVASTIVVLYILIFVREPFKQRVLRVVDGFKRGGMDTARIVAIVFAAQMLISILSMSGIASRVANELAGADIPKSLSLVFLAAVVIVLGFGVPTAAAYVLAASIATPIFFSIGLEPIAGHMFILYFTVYANVTPPVMPATYAAVAIARADMMKAGIEGTKLMLPLVIVPFAFALEPHLLLNFGTPLEVAYGMVRMIIGMSLLAAGLAFWLFRPLRKWEGIVLSIGAFLFAWPGVETTIAGTVITLVVLGPLLVSLRRGDFKVATTGAGVVRLQDGSVSTMRNDEWHRTVGQVRAAFHGIDLPGMRYEVNERHGLAVTGGLTGMSLAALVAARDEGAISAIVPANRWPLPGDEVHGAGLAIVASQHDSGETPDGPYAIRPVELEMNVRAKDPADPLVEATQQRIHVLADSADDPHRDWIYDRAAWDDAVRQVARAFGVLASDRILIWHDDIHRDHIGLLLAFAALENDAVIVLDESCPEFDPARWLQVVADGGVTTALLSNERLAAVTEHIRSTGSEISVSLSAIIHGGTRPLDEETFRASMEVFGPINIQYVLPTDELVGTVITAEEWLEHEYSIGKVLNNGTRVVTVDAAGVASGDEGRLAFELVSAAARSRPSLAAVGAGAGAGSTPTEDEGRVVTDLVGTVDRDGYVYLRRSHNDG
jgi:TRAP transporter 4TM/12TM fusion protein